MKTKEYMKIFSPNGKYKTKDYINVFLSDSMERLGFKYTGNFTWCSPWDNGMRKVIGLFLLKGDSAIFEWGYNFDFLPEVKSGTLRYYRTEKSVNIQLREMPKLFIDYRDWEEFKIPMHSDNLEELEKYIRLVWSKTLPFIEQWFKRVDSLENAGRELEYQIHYGKYYNTFLPEQSYVQAFILSKIGKTKDALEIIRLTRTYNTATKEMREKILGKLEG